MNHLLTVHIVNEIPWSNLNRDDTGLPKRMQQGGTQRGLLSSQSIKRGARGDYEAVSRDISVRSANLAALVAKRASELNPELGEKAVAAAARKSVGELTKASSAGSDSEKEAGRSAWLSAEELETLAHAISEGQKSTSFIDGHRTGSLAIAAFGRMFAAKPGLQTEAAIAVSPAVSTHRTVIEADYFSTTDDSPTVDQGAGATFLGISHFINGIFYRSVTIDRKQLQISWTGLDQPGAADKLRQMVTALIYGMPRGKANATAPYTAPSLVLIETQAYRIAYDFEQPVQPAPEGGYLDSTLDRLRQERDAAKRFDPENFGAPQAVAGTANDLKRFGMPVTDRPGIADQVAKWILDQ